MPRASGLPAGRNTILSPRNRKHIFGLRLGPHSVRPRRRQRRRQRPMSRLLQQLHGHSPPTLKTQPQSIHRELRAQTLDPFIPWKVGTRLVHRLGAMPPAVRRRGPTRLFKLTLHLKLRYLAHLPWKPLVGRSGAMPPASRRPRAMPLAPRQWATTPAVPATPITYGIRVSNPHFLVELPDDRGQCPRRPGSEGLWPLRAMPSGPQHSSLHLRFP